MCVEANVWRAKVEHAELVMVKRADHAKQVRMRTQSDGKLAKTALTEQRKAAGLERRLSYISRSVEKAAAERAVDCHGKAGTVVFYHASLAHSAGENHGTAIRQGVLTGWGVSEAAMPEDRKLEHIRRNELWLDWGEQVRAGGSEPPVPRPARWR